MPLILGADIGGTATRIALLRIRNESGRSGSPVLSIEAEVTGEGGNFRSNPAAAAQTIAATLKKLRGTGRTISSACFGIAGAGAAGHDTVSEFVRHGLTLGGFDFDPAGVEVVSDIDIAFSAAGRQRSGLLVLAGTGAVSARFDDDHVTRRTDGMGWLLGDQGSGVWIGRRCLEAVAAHVDGRGPETLLTRSIFAALNLPDPGDGTPHKADMSRDSAPQQLISAVYQLSVRDIAALALHAGTAAGERDPVALNIVREAAVLIVRNARDAWAPKQLAEPMRAPEVVVLAGGVLLKLDRLRTQVESGLKGHFGSDLNMVEAGQPIVGALHRAAYLAGRPLQHAEVARVFSDRPAFAAQSVERLEVTGS